MKVTSKYVCQLKKLLYGTEETLFLNSCLLSVLMFVEGDILHKGLSPDREPRLCLVNPNVVLRSDSLSLKESHKTQMQNVGMGSRFTYILFNCDLLILLLLLLFL